MIVRPNKSASNYEVFNKLYTLSRDYLRRAIETDEKYDDEAGKRKSMELYRKAIGELDKALQVPETSIPDEKKAEFKKRRQTMQMNSKSVSERLGDLVKMYPPSSKGSLSSSSSSSSVKIQHRGVGIATDRRLNTSANSTTIKRNLPTAERPALLKNVDAKLGGALLDEMLDETGVQFSDIVGGEVAKRALEEAVILPALNPQLFSGLRQPVRGILLFGPPGNGKTMLAKAVATESKSTFFNISASSLTSKWVGEAEKTIRCLFEIAKNAQPSIIFIDEVDSILCERSDKETEVSRRMKTEFLVQLDGCRSLESDRVLVMAATNRPFDLDDGILRRFPKRILIDMPDEKARQSLIGIVLKKHKTNHNLSGYEMGRLAHLTDGYSNADLVSLCREAAMVPIRHLTRNQLMNTTEAQIRPIKYSDFEEALQAIKPSVNQKVLEKLREFTLTNGQTG